MIVPRFFKNIVLLCLFYSCAISSISAQGTYGLGFNSFEVVQDKRTGLNLTPSGPFSFPDGFSLSFDVCFQSEYRYHYGYIFRIIGANEQHIDFLLSNKDKLIVTHSLNKTIADFSFGEINFMYDSYFPFEIQFDLKNSILYISFGGKRVSIKLVSMENFKDVSIVFGKCDYPQRQISDIPKMLIKDIKINDHKGLPVYYWQLSKHTRNGVFDEIKKRFAQVENPQWMIDHHALWKKQISFNMKYIPRMYVPQICYNQDKSRIIVANQEFVYSYDIKTHRSDGGFKNGMLGNFYTNQTVYNPFTQSYYSYFDVGEELLVYDTLLNNRDTIDRERIADAYYMHHNKIVSPLDSCLYTFGGYGHYIYNNIINKYDFKTRTWEEVHFSGDQIRPRYLSGLGAIDENKILIFGGYGSETGAQELSPQNFYDLHLVDMKNRSIKKIWELTSPKDNFVVANSIVVDTLNKCFYALCFPQQLYNTSLSLRKFSMESPESEILTNNIPFAFQDVYSYVDLFLNKETEELIAVTSSSIVADSIVDVSIYSLAYPPLAEADLLQSEESDCSLGLWGIISIFILLCFGGWAMYYFKKKKNAKQGISRVKISGNNSKLQTDDIESDEFVRPIIDKQAIFLFGGFRVMDKDGGDITGEFSPLLKQLFLIILLNTLKDGKGVSSLKLKDTLWFDKTQESAKNNRGVLLSRLRQIFEQVGVVNIENKNSLWTIHFGEGVYCDYYEAVTLMKKLKEEESLTNNDVRELLFIVSGGEMLPNLQIDWVDSFKADFSNDLIDILSNVEKHPNLKLSSQEYIDLADAIFAHDSLSEDAIRLKCKTLIKMGKNGLAKRVYNSFTKEYHVSFGAKFKYSFDQIVSN